MLHVRGAIHAIMEMELHTKFHKAEEAVETALFDLNIAKSTLKAELKKGEGDDTSRHCQA